MASGRDHGRVPAAEPDGNGPDWLALMQRISTDVAKIDPGKDAMRGKLKQAGWSDDALVDLVRVAVESRTPPKLQSDCSGGLAPTKSAREGRSRTVGGLPHAAVPCCRPESGWGH